MKVFQLKYKEVKYIINLWANLCCKFVIITIILLPAARLALWLSRLHSLGRFLKVLARSAVPLRICHYPMPFTSFLPIPAHCALHSLVFWLYLDSSCAPTSSPSPCDFRVLSSCPTFPHGSFSQLPCLLLNDIYSQNPSLSCPDKLAASTPVLLHPYHILFFLPCLIFPHNAFHLTGMSLLCSIEQELGVIPSFIPMSRKILLI